MSKIKKDIGRSHLFNQIQEKVILEFVSNYYLHHQSPNIDTIMMLFVTKFDMFYNYVRNSKKMKAVIAPVFESILSSKFKTF